MTEKEAKILERLIRQDAPTLPLEREQIGNGEWVLVSGGIHIWDEDNWESIKDHPDILAKRLIA